jgi:ketosteroid isomerase-like protein
MDGGDRVGRCRDGSVVDDRRCGFSRAEPARDAKADFAAAARAQAGPQGPKIEGSSEIQEIKVLGDWAFVWSRLSVVIAPRGAQAVTRAGYTLSIFRKQGGKWLLARDANMLAPVQK